tara:strand:- start:3685 stop:4599 length:915 start_codon:yes stop_codon:yes gene_type:complete
MSKILSLCSGYGGLDLAVEAHFADAHTAYWSDIDPSACAVMETRFPDAEPVGDLTQFGDTAFDCDILTAGYPCQPFSTAGKRLGENDERHLWPYIANTISVSRPRWVILENVANHVNLGGPTVVGTLAQLGYRTRFGLVSASAAGAPHQRKRLFIVAQTDSASGETRVDTRRDSELLRKEPLGSAAPPSDSNSIPAGRNGRTPLGKEELNRRGEPNQGNRSADGAPTNWGEYATAIHRWEHILGRPAPSPIDDNKLSAHFAEWMMGLEKNWVCGIVESRAKALTTLGNGVVPQQGLLALRELTS